MVSPIPKTGAMTLLARTPPSLPAFKSCDTADPSICDTASVTIKRDYKYNFNPPRWTVKMGS